MSHFTQEMLQSSLQPNHRLFYGMLEVSLTVYFSVKLPSLTIFFLKKAVKHDKCYDGFHDSQPLILSLLNKKQYIIFHKSFHKVMSDKYTRQTLLCTKQRLLYYFSLSLLQNCMFNLVCYLPFLSNRLCFSSK